MVVFVGPDEKLAGTGNVDRPAVVEEVNNGYNQEKVTGHGNSGRSTELE